MNNYFVKSSINDYIRLIRCNYKTWPPSSKNASMAFYATQNLFEPENPPEEESSGSFSISIKWLQWIEIL